MRSEPDKTTPADLDVRAVSTPGHDQLVGLQARLERELARAFGMQPWPGDLIARLANQLQETEDALVAGRPVA